MTEALEKLLEDPRAMSAHKARKDALEALGRAEDALARMRVIGGANDDLVAIGEGMAAVRAALDRFPDESENVSDDGAIETAGQIRAEAGLARIEKRLEERFNEIAMLTQMLRDAERDEDRAWKAAEHLMRAFRLLIEAEGLPFLPARLRVGQMVAALKRSGLFDAGWYLKEYRDVAEAGIDPSRHYVMYGAREGRAPNATVAEVVERAKLDLAVWG